MLVSAYEGEGGVTYEILDMYGFLVTELVVLDDFLLNYLSLICHREKI